MARTGRGPDNRALEHRGPRPQMGYLLATCPWHERLLVDVARGSLPGGAPGVVAYEARPFEESMRWLFPTGFVVRPDRGT